MSGAPLGGADPVTILVGGHESAHGADLAALLGELPDAVVTPPGRALRGAVTSILATDAASVLVLPMTWGRDPRMVADTARTLSWIASASSPGRLALCAPFGTPDHLVAWLRRATGRVAGRDQEQLRLVDLRRVRERHHGGGHPRDDRPHRPAALHLALHPDDLGPARRRDLDTGAAAPMSS